MDADPAMSKVGASLKWEMRTGRKLGRTLYFHDPREEDWEKDICVGMVDTEFLARKLCDLWNEHHGHK